MDKRALTSEKFPANSLPVAHAVFFFLVGIAYAVYLLVFVLLQIVMSHSFMGRLHKFIHLLLKVRLLFLSHWFSVLIFFL